MKKSTWALFAVLLGLGVVTYVVMQRPGEQSSTGPDKLLVEFDSAAVDRIEIRSASGAVTLEKAGGEWNITSPLRYRADPAGVGSALGNAHKIQLSSLVSTNPQKQALFQVDSAGTLVRLFTGSDEKAAFRVGKMGPSYTETYVRREGSDDVYLAGGMIGTTFARRPNDWRDKAIFKADQSSITGVTFHYGDTVFTLAFRDSAWFIGDQKPDAQTVTGVVNALSNLPADEFVDSTVTGMPTLAAQIAVGGVQLRFFPIHGGDKTYVQSSATPQLFEVYNWRVQQILKREKDFVKAG